LSARSPCERQASQRSTAHLDHDLGGRVFWILRLGLVHPPARELFPRADEGVGAPARIARRARARALVERASAARDPLGGGVDRALGMRARLRRQPAVSRALRARSVRERRDSPGGWSDRLARRSMAQHARAGVHRPYLLLTVPLASTYP